MGAIIFLLYLLIGIGIAHPVGMWIRWKLFYSKKISFKEFWKDA